MEMFYVIHYDLYIARLILGFQLVHHWQSLRSYIKETSKEPPSPPLARAGALSLGFPQPALHPLPNPDGRCVLHAPVLT